MSNAEFKRVLTIFLVAGIGAVIVEHFLRPTLAKKIS